MDEEVVKCGNCGNDTATIRAVRRGEDRHRLDRLILVCTQCKERSIVEIPDQPAMTIEFSENSSGRFCVGWGVGWGEEKA